MNPNLLFDFTVNKENKTIHVKREFNAELEWVWKAWTTPEILDQWWGPAPWRAETKYMDFNPGGYWLYAMVSPEGEKHWSKMDYISIETEKSFTGKDGFSDENGVINKDFPQNRWENEFSYQNDRTLVSIISYFDTLEDLEQIIAMGFEQGFTAGLNQLEVLLEKLKN